MNISQGITPTEQYLSRLGKRSFLSLWSYPNVYYAPGKEFADLLVVFGNDIIIFQDKQSLFPSIEDVDVGWKRWFKHTVAAGAKQVWGAERRYRSGMSHLFLDSACKVPFPLPLPKSSTAVCHLVVVTHGGSTKCTQEMGGSGSFMINMNIVGLDGHDFPFAIGDLDQNRTFVHVFDDTTLDILMRALDTVTEFRHYLLQKVNLLRGKSKILATGEEEMLVNFLSNLDKNGWHNFDFGIRKEKEADNLAILGENSWLSFSQSPQRLAQLEQDKISYVWDGLIEAFNSSAIAGRQYSIPDFPFSQGIGATEEVVRFMAKEPRFARRVFSRHIMEAIETTAETARRIKVMPSCAEDGVYFVLLLFPLEKNFNEPHDEYRKKRAAFLEGTCMATKLIRPDAQHIIGIATESGVDNGGRSEDVMYFDATVWDSETEEAAAKFRDEFGVLVKPNEVVCSVKEYPDVVSRDEFLKNPRNKPCPCGSEKKYKKCCLPKGRNFYR